MSKTIDLTGDNSSSDGSSVEDRPKPKRGRMSAELRNAPSILSNSGGGVALLGSRQVSCSAASFNSSSAAEGKIIHMSYCCNIFTYF